MDNYKEALCNVANAIFERGINCKIVAETFDDIGILGLQETYFNDIQVFPKCRNLGQLLFETPVLDGGFFHESSHKSAYSYAELEEMSDDETIELIFDLLNDEYIAMKFYDITTKDFIIYNSNRNKMSELESLKVLLSEEVAINE